MFWQLATGHGYPVSPLWYLAVLIWITLLFSLLSVYLKEKAIFVFISLGLLCLLFQHAGWNYGFFKNCSHEITHSFGRVAEMIPYAALGCVVSYENQHIVSCVRQRPYLLIVLLFSSFVFWKFYRRFPVPGFPYSGVFLLAGATCFAMFFYLLPLQWLSGKQKKIITFFGAHTLGIYCMHYPVGYLFNLFFENHHIKVNSFVFCVFVYILCFWLSHLISLLPYKMTKILVD